LAKVEPAERRGVVESEARQPGRPPELPVFGLRPIAFYQRKLRQIREVLQRHPSVEQRWRADREDYLAEQRHFGRISGCRLGRPFDDGDVDPVAQEIGFASIDCRDPDLDFRMQRGKPPQAWYEPPDREGGGRRDRQDTDAALVSDALAGENALEARAYALEECSALGGHLDGTMMAVKQPRAEMFLEGSDLVANSALR
jgi:hypothetical protein